MGWVMGVGGGSVPPCAMLYRVQQLQLHDLSRPCMWIYNYVYGACGLACGCCTALTCYLVFHKRVLTLCEPKGGRVEGLDRSICNNEWHKHLTAATVAHSVAVVGAIPHDDAKLQGHALPECASGFWM